jgi:predicted AAA+ superfamily ATPase
MATEGAMFPRGARELILEALGDTRVVLLQGARQTGKSTLARQIVAEEYPAQIVNFDQRAAREAALRDPTGFIAGLDRPVLIDEIQRGGPELLLAIKSIVDRDLSPGQFLLTGSTNLLRSPRTLDPLTGRVDVIALWPLAQAEIEGAKTNFVDALFSGKPPRVTGAPIGRDALRDRIGSGGYPEARLRSGRSRSRWFESYLRMTLERDLESIADAYRLQEVPRLLRLLAAQTANLFVPAALGGKLGLDHRTVERYVGLLEATFLVRRIPAWRPGLGQREVQHPKAYVVDSGLLLHLLGAGEERLLDDDQITGKALESFVAMEIVKHAEWAAEEARLHHYRRGRDEIDLVLENRAGDIGVIEVKSRASLEARDWRAMERLRDARGAQFRCGFIVHTGADTVPLGDRLFAVPLSGLWA